MDAQWFVTAGLENKSDQRVRASPNGQMESEQSDFRYYLSKVAKLWWSYDNPITKTLLCKQNHASITAWHDLIEVDCLLCISAKSAYR